MTFNTCVCCSSLPFMTLLISGHDIPRVWDMQQTLHLLLPALALEKEEEEEGRRRRKNRRKEEMGEHIIWQAPAGVVGEFCSFSFTVKPSLGPLLSSLLPLVVWHFAGRRNTPPHTPLPRTARVRTHVLVCHAHTQHYTGLRFSCVFSRCVLLDYGGILL